MIVNELKCNYKLFDLLFLVGIAESTYHYHNNELKKTDKYADLKNEISSIFDKHNGKYDYRRIHRELVNRGKRINHKTVYRLIKELGLICNFRVKKPKYNMGNENIIVANLLAGDFNSSAPNEKFVTDVTEFRVCGKRLYLSPILDLYNGEIISYSISHHQNFKLVTDMLNKAFNKVSDVSGLLLHSDQGCLYRIERYHNLLKQKGIIQSMSRKGNCYDNAVIENFFGILKSEMFHNKKFESVEDFISKLHSYIYYYNNERIKTKLKMSPVEYRTRNLIA